MPSLILAQFSNNYLDINRNWLTFIVDVLSSIEVMLIDNWTPRKSFRP
jgi:hypothetical protein